MEGFGRIRFRKHTLEAFFASAPPYVGGCQNYGPFLGPYYNTAPIIYGTQKGTLILTTTHMFRILKGRTCLAGRNFKSFEETSTLASAMQQGSLKSSSLDPCRHSGLGCLNLKEMFEVHQVFELLCHGSNPIS